MKQVCYWYSVCGYMTQVQTEVQERGVVERTGNCDMDCVEEMEKKVEVIMDSPFNQSDANLPSEHILARTSLKVREAILLIRQAQFHFGIPFDDFNSNDLLPPDWKPSIPVGKLALSNSVVQSGSYSLNLDTYVKSMTSMNTHEVIQTSPISMSTLTTSTFKEVFGLIYMHRYILEQVQCIGIFYYIPYEFVRKKDQKPELIKSIEDPALKWLHMEANRFLDIWLSQVTREKGFLSLNSVGGSKKYTFPSNIDILAEFIVKGQSLSDLQPKFADYVNYSIENDITESNARFEELNFVVRWYNKEGWNFYTARKELVGYIEMSNLHEYDPRIADDVSRCKTLKACFETLAIAHQELQYCLLMEGESFNY